MMSDEEILFNPAFIGQVLCNVVKGYTASGKKSMPVSLIYVSLPMILPDKIRISLKEHSLQNWCFNNQCHLIFIPDIARVCVPIVNQAISFLIQEKWISLVGDELILISKKSIVSHTDCQNIEDYLRKASKLGDWFSKANSPKNVYYLLGVRP